MAGRRLLVAAILACLAIPAPAARDKPAARQAAPAKQPAPAKPAASEEDLKELRERIERAQRQLASAEESRGEAVDALKASEKAVSDVQRALHELVDAEAAINVDLAAIAAHQATVRAGIATQQALAEKLLRLQYERGGEDRLRLLLEGKDLSSVARHLEYYGYIQRERADVLARLKADALSLEQLEAEARAKHDDLAENRAAQAREARRLEKERTARAAVVKRIAGQIAQGRREIGKLKRDEERLAKLVEEIAKAVAAQSKESARRKGVPVDEVADASLAAREFASLKGKLKLPVRGELMNRYGSPREEGSATWKGLFIRAVTGETVRAVADGRVVYADWLRGFGNLLIVDHGGGYMSLYGYNDGLLKQVGESVRSGDAVAQVGASGGAEESGLYFELRRAGKPFDPLAWVAR